MKTLLLKRDVKSKHEADFHLNSFLERLDSDYAVLSQCKDLKVYVPPNVLQSLITELNKLN